MKALAIILSFTLFFILFFVIRFYFLGQNSQKMQVQLGLKKGRLLPCGPKPNCVSGSFKIADKIKLVENIKGLKSSVIITENENYLYLTVTSKIFGFVDDLEFYFPQDESIVYYRSASRVGHSDFGQNKKRIDRLFSI